MIGPPLSALANLFYDVFGYPFIVSEPEVENSLRPRFPYVTFKAISPSIRSGTDYLTDDLTGLIGPRTALLDFNVFSSDGEEAAEIAAGILTRLETGALDDALGEIGVSVYPSRSEIPRDLSLLYNAGYQPRVGFTLRIGYLSRFSVDVGEITSAPVVGVAEP